MNPLASSSVPGASSTETSEGSLNVSASIDEAFRWNVRPSDKEPAKRWVIILAALFAFVLGVVLFRNFVFGVIGFAIVALSTAEYWLGTSFWIDEKSANARTGFSVSGMAWSDVKRAFVTEDGIKLSPLATESRMSTFRGVFLKFGDQREQVMENVRRWLPTNVELVG